MKVWKIVSGILSITLSLFVAFQSLFAGAYNILTGNGQSSGTAGVLVAIALLTGGIVSLATCNGSVGGNIAIALLYGIGGFIGLVMAGSYADLRIWSVWAILCAIIAIVGIGLMVHEEDEGEVEVPPRPDAPNTRRGPATFQDIILEPDPVRRSAAIDAMPERQAKSFLKHALNVLIPRQNQNEDDNGLINVLLVVLGVIGVGIVAIIVVGFLLSRPGNQNEAAIPPALTPLRTLGNVIIAINQQAPRI